MTPARAISAARGVGAGFEGRRVSCRQTARPVPRGSWQTSARKNSPAPFDLYGYQRAFSDRVRAYFQASGLSPAEIAVAYGVDPTTAKNWLEGRTCPRAAQIVLVSIADPDGFRRHFQGVA